MSEREAFERRVIEQPDDDTVRLVFADWLDEHGEAARAELIRLQVGGCSFVELCRAENRWREDERVVRAMRKEFLFDESWRWAIDGGQKGWVPPIALVRRGFVSHIELPCGTFLKHAKALFSRHPITSVVLSDVEPWSGQYEGMAVWTLSRGEYLQASFSENVPEEIFDFITEGEVYGWLFMLNKAGSRLFQTRELALDALSHACVAYGRSLVRPELPVWEPKPAPVRGA